MRARTTRSTNGPSQSACTSTGFPMRGVITRSRTLMSIRGFRSTSGGRRSMSGPMPDDALVLHVETMWASPYVFSSWVALHEKGLRLDVREVARVDVANRPPADRPEALLGDAPA